MAQIDVCAEKKQAVTTAYVNLVSLLLEARGRTAGESLKDPRMVSALTDVEKALVEYSGCQCVHIVRELSR